MIEALIWPLATMTALWRRYAAWVRALKDEPCHHGNDPEQCEDCWSEAQW